MENTYTAADKQAVKILRHLYAATDSAAETILYNARQYLQDRARYERNAAILSRTRRELAINFDIPARDIIGMACSQMGINESQWRTDESRRIAREEALNA